MATGDLVVSAQTKRALRRLVSLYSSMSGETCTHGDMLAECSEATCRAQRVERVIVTDRRKATR